MTLYCDFCYSVGKVEAQENCEILPSKPSSLTVNRLDETTTKGVLVDGTINVTLQCSCRNRRGLYLRPIRWHSPNSIFLSRTSNPYAFYTSGNRVAYLVIPLFNESFKGTYTCGIGNNLTPSITVDLELGKMHTKISL